MPTLIGDLIGSQVTLRVATTQVPRARLLLLYPPGLDYVTSVFGCFYAGAIAVPAYPPDPLRLERSFPRLQAIARDARPHGVLKAGPQGHLPAPLGEDLDGARVLDTQATISSREGRYVPLSGESA